MVALLECPARAEGLVFILNLVACVRVAASATRVSVLLFHPGTAKVLATVSHLMLLIPCCFSLSFCSCVFFQYYILHIVQASQGCVLCVGVPLGTLVVISRAMDRESSSFVAFKPSLWRAEFLREMGESHQACGHVRKCALPLVESDTLSCLLL